MTAAIYGLPNCDTCRKARKWLVAHDIDHRFVDYRAQPVPATMLETWANALGGWDKLVNKSSTSWRGLTDAEKSAGSGRDWIRLIGEHPTLIKRPVLVLDDGSISVGFSPAGFEQRFEQG